MKQPHIPKIEFRAEIYQRAYAAVLTNPYWYSDRPRLLNETFNAVNTR
jgi:spore maturation protein CgeB